MLTHMSLFSGIGGMDVAAEWAGFETVGQCEWADYQTKVLENHWPDVPRWRDIRGVTAQDFIARTGMGTVTVLSGGFPCQPFSVAGKQRGSDDDRYLWPEMLRVISELKPTWVIGENVPGIVNMALDQVLSDLEGQGYEVQPFLIPACGVDAPHRRERVFILAYTGQQPERHEGSRLSNQQQHSGTERFRTTQGDGLANCGQDVADSYGTRKLQPSGDVQEFRERTCDSGKKCAPYHSIGNVWAVEPNVGRVAHGIPKRVDKLRCLGNAVVPRQVYPIFQFIADIERTANQ